MLEKKERTGIDSFLNLAVYTPTPGLRVWSRKGVPCRDT